MKKIIKLILLVLISIVLSYLVYEIVAKAQYKNKIERTLQVIPKFSFKTLEGSDFTQVDLKEGISTVFIYFNTECDYCQHEAKSISEHLTSFKAVQLFFISTEDTDIIKAFADNYNLLNQPNIHFLNDNTHIFSNRFDANSIPYVLIYNGQQELVKKHKGQINAKTILQALE